MAGAVGGQAWCVSHAVVDASFDWLAHPAAGMERISAADDVKGTALPSSFAFGGSNAAVILAR